MSLALFDLDNTLIDRRAMFRRWAAGMLERCGVAQSGALEWLIEVDGNGYGDKERWMPVAAERFGIPERDIAADRAEHWVAAIEVAPTVAQALERLAGEGWALGMVTNGPASQWDKINAAELGGHFDAVVVSELVGTRKPEAAIFRLAAELCGHPLEGWMVGDHPRYDMQGARAVGLRTAWMQGPEPWPDELQPPDLVASTIGEFVDHVLAD
jgi:putative hydrolase of the HAD superfamily